LRIRALKPGFFKNEQLAELSPWHRLCYEGLWCVADKEGRLQDRPKRLKVEIFPYDDLNMDGLLWDLTHAGFIRRYVIGHQPLICIPSWFAHQRPRPDETPSELGAYVEGADRATGTLDVSTFPAVRAIDIVPSLSSDDPDAAARMGKGMGMGSGILEREGSSAATAARSIRAQDLLDLWNATVRPPFPKCRELTDDRRRKIRTRLAYRPNLAEWREAFEALLTIPFFRGENDRQWVADFDYLIRNDTKIVQVLERARTQRPTPTGRITKTLAAALDTIAAEAKQEAS
jgi:hypothetical protein